MHVLDELFLFVVVIAFNVWNISNILSCARALNFMVNKKKIINVMIKISELMNIT